VQRPAAKIHWRDRYCPAETGNVKNRRQDPRRKRPLFDRSRFGGSGRLGGGDGRDQAANSPRSRRTSLRHLSQERNFSTQRQRRELGTFSAISVAETAFSREFNRHVFETAALMRVFRMLCNLGVCVVGATGIEPVTPSMSTRCSPAELRALRLPDGWRSYIGSKAARQGYSAAASRGIVRLLRPPASCSLR
jgi:hypothetical protein